MAKQNIVVVGAGYAGVSATKYLAKKLKRRCSNYSDRSSFVPYYDDRVA